MKRLLLALGIAGGMLASGAVGAVASNGWTVPTRHAQDISFYPQEQGWQSAAICDVNSGGTCVVLHSDYTWEWSKAVPYFTGTTY